MSKQPLVTTSFLPLARMAARHSGNLSHAMIFSRKFTRLFCRHAADWQRFSVRRSRGHETYIGLGFLSETPHVVSYLSANNFHTRKVSVTPQACASQPR